MVVAPKQFEFKLRKTAHQLAYHKRYKRLTGNDQVQIDRLKKILVVIIHRKRQDCHSKEYKAKLDVIQRGIIITLLFTMLENPDAEDPDIRPCPNKKKKIDDFDLGDSTIFFRFKKQELESIVRELRFPDAVTLDSSRHTMSGEEVFLRGLYEMVSGENQYKIAKNVFGGTQPRQSAATKFFFDHIYENFKHLVTDNLAWWHRNGFLEQSTAAIGAKAGIPNNLIGLFIDCNSHRRTTPFLLSGMREF